LRTLESPSLHCNSVSSHCNFFFGGNRPRCGATGDELGVVVEGGAGGHGGKGLGFEASCASNDAITICRESLVWE